MTASVELAGISNQELDQGKVGAAIHGSTPRAKASRFPKTNFTAQPIVGISGNQATTSLPQLRPPSRNQTRPPVVHWSTMSMTMCREVVR